MSKPEFDNNNSSLKHKTGSLMASNPLIDSLTSHISLYHSAISNGSSSLNRNPNPRLSILKWFSSLTVHQRQASLTIVDHGFVQILLQMLGKMRTQGHGFFFVLPDLPSRDSAGMPSLCFRKSNGLLARVSEVNDGERFVYEAVLMFESNEGEEVKECECSSKLLDTVTVSEEFVANVDRFVGVMDGVSNGEFLRGEENVMGSNDWIELGWLKDKGYYNVEAFVANRIEVALRLAWLNSNRNKKKGVKLKEKVDAAGVAANVYWRKKGCVDWWKNLDATLKIKVLTGVLGKATKPLVDEILNGSSKGTKGEMCIFNTEVEKPLRYNYSKVCRKTTVVSFDSLIDPATVSTNHTPFAKCLNSTLGSVNTISDCILRKLRGLLMVVSLDCIKRELLGEGNQGSTPIKCNEKTGAGNRKKKSKTRNTKRLNPALESSGIDEPLKSTFQSQRCEQFHEQNGKAVESENVPVIHLEKNRDILSSEHPRSLEEKGNNATRKSRRERKKTKKAFPNSISRNIVACSNANYKIQGNTLELDGRSDDLSVQNGVKDNSSPAHSILKSSLNDSVNRPLKEEIVPVSISNVVTGCTSGGCQNDVISHQNLNSSIATSVVVSSEVDKLSNSVDCNIKITAKSSPSELGSAFSSKSCNFWNTGHSSGNRSKSVSKATVREQECEISFNTERTSSMDCISYEWPNVAPIHSSMAKSPIPAATDRLHLDAGRNWHNHFHRSFVPAMHQTRNPSIEGGGSRMGSRPLPVSLDWPPMVRAGALAPSVACNYDYKFISRRQSSFQQAFSAQNVRIKATTIDDERKIFGDSIEVPFPTNMQDFSDDGDSHWISEEEYEMHAMDCNQYFGGGVMYWDPSDIPRTSFSRPPSLSSDDSSWAWHEVEMKRAVDDMVAFSSSYSTNGLTSPTAASYCSAFDPLGTAHQALGYVMPPGNEGTGMVMHPASAVVDSSLDEKISGSMSTFPSDVEGLSGDSLPYPILAPIIIPNLSRERSRSEFQRSHEHRSPCVPPFRRDHPRIKRPPSPVVLCVPQAPSGPPPPSSVSNSRKHRGFPTVRSGSSSPRNWGVKGWYNDGANFDESCICMDGTEVILPSWRSNNLSARPMVQALPGALFSDHMIAISHMALDKEHPDVTFPIEPPDSLTCLTWKTSRPLMQNFLHDEINSFCKQVAAENVSRKPYINWAVNRVTRALQVLWPRSRTNIFGSIATGLSLPSSDVDLVVGLPPVRNLEPIKEAGILEGRNGIKETCLQHAARYLSNQEWVKSDSLKTVENTAIPIIMLVVEVPYTLITNVTSHVPPKGEATFITSEDIKQVHVDIDGLRNSGSPTISNPKDECGKDPKLVRIDISFKSPSHTGVQTTKLVKELTELFPAATPLALVLKQFLSDRSLDQSYCGGLSSYCLMLLITRFLQHEHHLGRSINQNFGSLLMDFLYFFGNVYDPRQIRISVQGSGVYIKRERGYSIDPIHIDDPLFPTNNVGRNCFRIHQCIKAFSDAYSLLESELPGIPTDGGLNTVPPCRLLPKIIPSIDLYRKSKD